MPRRFTISNPALNGIAARDISYDIPEEGELFKTPGGGLGLIKNNQLFQLKEAEDIKKLGVTGRTWEELTSNLYKKLGIDESKLQEYNTGDFLPAGIKEVGVLTVPEIEEAYKKAGTFTPKGGITETITGPGAKTFAEVPQSQISTQSQTLTQPQSQTGQVEGALTPSVKPINQTLAQIVEEQAKTLGNKLANQNYVNAVFQAYHGRDATAEELKRYTMMSVANALNEIKGGIKTSQPATTTAPAGYQLIRNPAELEQLAKQGLTEDDLWRDPLSARIYYKPEFKVETPSVIGEELRKEGKVSTATLNDFLNKTSILKTEDKTNSLLDEIRDRLFSDANFNQRINAELETKYGIEGINSQLAEIDKQIAIEKQSLNQGLLAIQNSPISLSQIHGQMGQMQKTIGVRLEGLVAVREAIAGDLDRAYRRMDRAVDAYVADKKYEHSLLSSWYNEIKEDMDKDEQKRWQLFLRNYERDIEDDQLRVKTLASIMFKYPDAGINLTDSYEDAQRKILKSKVFQAELAHESRLAYGGGVGGGTSTITTGGVSQPSSKSLDKLLTNYPLEFKAYIKGIAPNVTFTLDTNSIALLYQQWRDLKSKGILPFGEVSKEQQQEEENELEQTITDTMLEILKNRGK